MENTQTKSPTNKLFQIIVIAAVGGLILKALSVGTLIAVLALLLMGMAVFAGRTKQ